MPQTFYKTFEATDRNDLSDAIGKWLNENHDIIIVSSSLSELHIEGYALPYTITESVFYTFEKGA